MQPIDVSRELIKTISDDTKATEAGFKTDAWKFRLAAGKELLVEEEFQSMKLKKEIIQGIFSFGHKKPSHIQKLTIPQIIKGDEIVVQSKSGTGKTLSFVSGVLNNIEKGAGTQAIILTPSRELTNQCFEIFQNFHIFTGTSAVKAVRGEKIENINAEVVIGASGSILRLLLANIIDSVKIKIVVLDEADLLLNPQGMGAQTCRILSSVTNSQKLYFSATFSPHVLNTISQFSPNTVQMLETNSKPEQIKLYNIQVNKSEKLRAVLDLFSCLPVAQSIIFVATKKMANVLSERFTKDCHRVSCIHGDLQPEERDNVLSDFKDAKTKILITTDVFSRGMDIPQVNLIINFDMPFYKQTYQLDTYIHRIGRSGRFGRKGFVIDFITNDLEMELVEKFAADLNSPSKSFDMVSLLSVASSEEIE